MQVDTRTPWHNFALKESKILALPPAAQRQFAQTYETMHKNLDRAMQRFEEVQEQTLTKKSMTSIKPMIMSRIIKTLAGQKFARPTLLLVCSVSQVSSLIHKFRVVLVCLLGCDVLLACSWAKSFLCEGARRQ